MTVTRAAADTIRLTDRGATLAAGAGCRAAGAHVVVCTARRADVHTGDRADTVTARGVPLRANGGTGGDTLTGGSRDDLIQGGGGPDLITGGAGADDLRGGRGEDFVFATRHGPDRITCGRGPNDTVVGANRRDLVGAGCELAFYGFSRERSMELGPLPVRRDRDSATFRLRCPSSLELDGATIPMAGSVVVRRGHRLLGAAQIPPRLGRQCGSHVSVPPHVDVRVPLRPHAAGRVVVSLHGHDVPHVGWAIRVSR